MNIKQRLTKLESIAPNDDTRPKVIVLVASGRNVDDVLGYSVKQHDYLMSDCGTLGDCMNELMAAHSIAGAIVIASEILREGALERLNGNRWD